MVGFARGKIRAGCGDVIVRRAELLTGGRDLGDRMRSLLGENQQDDRFEL